MVYQSMESLEAQSRVKGLIPFSILIYFSGKTHCKRSSTRVFVFIDQSFLQFLWKNVENLQIKSNDF